MISQKLTFIFFIWEFVKYGTSFSSLLTYTPRFHKVTFIPNITGNYTIDQYREKQFINGNVKIPAEGITKVIATFYRCNLEGANCEYFQAWEFSDVCHKIKEKNQIWSRIYSSFSPQIECPVNKVYYKMINATFDVSIVLLWYPEATEYVWKVTQLYYNEETYVGGVKTEVKLFGYRKRFKAKMQSSIKN